MEIVETEIAGVKKGIPMSFEEADSGNVNPDYIPESPTSENCPICVAGFKARLDGFPVKAKGYDETNEIMQKLGDSTRLAFIDKKTGLLPEYIRPKENYMPRLIKWFNENLKIGNYYSIEFYWKGISDGHILVIFNINGILELYDPQNDEKLFGKDIEDLLYSVRRNTIKLINLSNCFLNKHIVDYVLETQK